MHAKSYTLSLAGPVLLTCSDGTDLTPRSMKARGLLALLGTARHARLTRARLQDRLWSDRGPEQGAASLRQTLTEIRKGLGEARDLLQSGPGWVALDLGRVEVVILAPETEGGQAEFAADLDIRDPEFDDWLRDMRAEAEAMAAARKARGTPPAPAVLHEPRFEPEGETGLIARSETSGTDQVAEFGAMLMREAEARFADFLPPRASGARGPDDGPLLEMECQALGGPDRYTLQVLLHDRLRRGRLWSRTCDIADETRETRLGELADEIALALLRAATAAPQVATRRADEPPVWPLRDIFSFDAARLAAADTALAEQAELSTDAAAGPVLALRAYIRNTRFLERHDPNPEQTLDEAIALAARARELAPDHPVVLAASSLIAGLAEQHAFAYELARVAVRSGPANPLARLALSSALTEMDRHEDAYSEAVRTRESALSALNPATWLMRCSVAALRAGKTEEAHRFASSAHGFSPDYRPALRFMAALEFERRNEAGTVRALTKLKRIEPDFSLQLMASRSYPVASLRAMNLLGVTRSGLL